MSRLPDGCGRAREDWLMATAFQQTGSFHPLPVIGHPPAFYERHIKQAETTGDVHARASHKVGQYVTEAIDPKLPWEQKLKCFKHALKHHCLPPEGADDALQTFYRKLGEVVRRHAGTEALHAAQKFHMEAIKRVNGGKAKAEIEDEADDFFIGLLGHERTPEWCSREAAEQIGRLRQHWV
jgi:hypothetical protein